MRIIPLQAIASQVVLANLAGQNCQVSVYQKSTGLYCDVYLNNSIIIAGSLCLDRVKIVRDMYHGLIGDLAFVDQQGRNDPDYTGFGIRYLLYYLEASDFAAHP